MNKKPNNSNFTLDDGKFNGKELHQGSVSDDGENCVMLICSKDDIRDRLKASYDDFFGVGVSATDVKKISEERVDRIFARIEHKGSDFVMEQFWTVIDALIEDER